METQENLEKIGVGTKEATKLKPEIVTIVKAAVEEVGDKKAKKVVCFVKHPDQEDTIQISSAKIERRGKLEVSGLWFNQDEEGKIRKGSVLAQFLSFMKAENVESLEGMDCSTVEDDSGYLVFKAY